MFPAMVVRPLKLCSSCMYQASLKFSLFFLETAVTTNMPRLSDLIDVVVSTKRISNAKDHSAKLPSEVLTLFSIRVAASSGRNMFPLSFLFLLIDL